MPWSRCVDEPVAEITPGISKSVLHAFQKKSKSGVATLEAYIDLIKRRLKQATEISRKKE